MKCTSPIVLIGMPASGKSTLGKALADEIHLPFEDTDDWLEQDLGMKLEDFLLAHGREAFSKREGLCLQHRQPQLSVIATGGSAVYSPQAVKHLRGERGVIVYLSIALKSLEQRLPDFEGRGTVRSKGQNLASLYRERTPLYESLLDLRFEVAEGEDLPSSVQRLIKELESHE